MKKGRGGSGITYLSICFGCLFSTQVIAAAGGAEKVALLRARGADEVVDYTTENLRDRVKQLTGGGGVNVVFESVGGSVFDDCVRCIDWEGSFFKKKTDK
jgi:NADPH2:quinone reductase